MPNSNVKFVEPIVVPKRRMGFGARSALAPHLIGALDRYNLDVRRDDAGETYHLFSKDEGHHPRDILPDFIDCFEETENGIVFDLENLEWALEFMHQPVRIAMRYAAAQGYEDRADRLFEQYRLGLNSPEGLYKEQRALRAAIFSSEHRVSGQNVLRFLTTASVDIPEVTAEFTESDECHADEENKMRDKDAWMLNYEAGHAHEALLFDIEDPPEDKIKTIPGFHFDPSQGYVLKIHPLLLNDSALQGDQQNMLRDHLFDLLGLGNKTEIIDGARSIVLSPNEFSEFCADFYNIPGIQGLLQEVTAEENVQEQARRIADGCAALKDDEVFKRIAERTETSEDQRREALIRIFEASTALTPIIGGEHMAKLWRHFYPSQKNEMPFDDVIAEYADMNRNIEALLDQDLVSQEDLQSFANEYHKLLAFTDLTAKNMKAAAADQNSQSLLRRMAGVSAGLASTGLAYLFTDTGGDLNLLNTISYGLMARSGFSTLDKVLDGVMPGRKDQNQDLRNMIHTKMDSITNTVQSLSLAGVYVDEEHLEDHHQDTLSVMRKALRQDGSFLTQTLDAGKESGGEFIDDIFNALRDSKVTQAATVAMIGGLFWASLRGDSSTATEAVNAALDTASNTPDVAQGAAKFGLSEFLEADPSEFANIPRPPEIDFSCHMDFKVSFQGAVEAYKHCIFGTLVQDQASNIVSGTDFVIQKKIMNIMAHDMVNAFTEQKFGVSINGNEDNVFTKAARAAVKPTSKALMIINALQNITHAGLWSYSGKKGWDVGFSGYEESFSFIKPISNIVRRAVRAPFSAISTALHGVGVSLPLLPEASKSVHDHLYSLVNSSEPMKNVKPFRVSDVEDEAGIVADLAHISMKVGGFKQKFDLTDQGLRSGKEALDALDIKVRHLGKNLGVYSFWHHAMIRTHLDGVRNALNDFEHSGDVTKLKQGLKAYLGPLSGFEIRQTGQSQVFNALTGQDMSERTERVLKREANIAYGRESRLMARVNHTTHLMGVDITDNNKKPTLGSMSGAGVFLAGNHVFDKTILASRNVQRGVNFIGNRPVVNYSLKCGAALLVGGDAFGLLPEKGIAEGVTSWLGTAYGVGATGASFVVFNSGEDVVFVHSTFMSALITAGAVSALGAKKVVAPSLMTSAEELRENWGSFDVISGAEAVKYKTAEYADSLGQKIHKGSSKSAFLVQRGLKRSLRVPKSRYSETETRDREFAL